MTAKSICVYCGSSSGAAPEFGLAATAVGRAIADGGHRLVYGGGRVGLMETVADSALANGGSVVGVITEQLLGLEIAHQRLTELEVVADMHVRKARMAEWADGVIVLPGGYGTLDEAFEMLTWNQLGLVSVPVVFLDVNGYFRPLFEFIDRSVTERFMKPHHGALIQRVEDPVDAVRRAAANAPEYQPKWVG